ncbi:PHP domain-containing protein [Paenibacillus alkalitolerans]|uniref:PHP domain-containing protein n=1 Tax=Paenibacillus alkalitolerans TaxID=2799335 RepID=UPI0018F29997|nr:PHP domain-containing protein [Paenibacillus alkalitolerans]
MKEGKYDLHTHTTASDGRLTPAEIVRLAVEAGLAGLAITDHDTVSGVAEAVEAGKQLSVTVIPGVEISTSEGGGDVHVLGLWTDPEDETFIRRLAEQRESRYKRNEMVLEKLRQLGYDVSLPEAEAIAAERRSDKDRAVGRPHIAELLVRKGFVSSVAEAFDRLLGEGRKAYVNIPRVSPEKAVEWIHEAGGAAVLAHPGLYRDGESIARRLTAAGLDGLEAAHADHDEKKEERFRRLAESLGLAATAGSDFHGYRDGAAFHAPLGSRTADASDVRRLQALIERRGRGIQ